MYFSTSACWRRVDGILSNQMYSSDGDHSVLKILLYRHILYLWLSVVGLGGKCVLLHYGWILKRIWIHTYMYKLPFIRKTKNFRKTKKHWKIYPFRLETRSLCDTFAEFNAMNILWCSRFKIHYYVASSFNVQTPERRLGYTGVLTCS